MVGMSNMKEKYYYVAVLEKNVTGCFNKAIGNLICYFIAI